jgi:hypothetical protein
MVLEYREHLDRDKQDELQKLVEEYKIPAETSKPKKRTSR